MCNGDLVRGLFIWFVKTRERLTSVSWLVVSGCNFSEEEERAERIMNKCYFNVFAAIYLCILYCI